MPRDVIVIGRPESRIDQLLAVHLADEKLGCRRLDEPVAADDHPLIIDQRRIEWGGVNLLDAAALVVEVPLYPWPQEAGADGGERYRARQRRSLRISALRLAAARLAVINPPARAAELAASPALALLRCARAGLPVVEWRLGVEADATVPSLDCLGADDGCVPPPGPERLSFPGLALPVFEILVVGRDAIACREVTDFDPSVVGGAEPRAAVDPALGRVAAEATAGLGLEVAAVRMTSSGRIVLVDAAVDLAGWLESVIDVGVALARRIVEMVDASGETR